MEALDFAELDEEEMQLEYDVCCDEVAELQQELRASRLQAEQLRFRLRGVEKARSCSSTSLPWPGVCADEQQARDVQALLTWLAAHVEPAEEPEVLEVGFHVPIGCRRVHLRSVAQWLLPGSLRLSVPLGPARDELEALLATARATGRGQVDIDTARRFACTWELVTGELVVGQDGGAEPVALLAHRASDQGILVASWPTRTALDAALAKHGVFGACAPAVAPRAGERVEVEYDGVWYTGVFDHIDEEGQASVRCDVDAPGIITVAPLALVRRLEPDSRLAMGSDQCYYSSSRHGLAGHRRTRSAM